MNLPLRAVLGIGVALALSSCSLGPSTPEPTQPPPEPLVMTSNVPVGGTEPLTVDTLVRIDAEHGAIDRVVLSTTDGKSGIQGTISDGAWEASERLEPGLSYRLSAWGTGDDDKPQELTQTFSSQQLSLDQQTYPAVAPLAGETVGVGMPVIVYFDVPVKDHAAFEQQMSVTSTPKVEGSWSWFSDREVHYRPKDYWPAGTKVRVQLDLNSVPAGNGIYGQQDQDVSFDIGSQNISTVDMLKHTLTYTRDGKKLKTIKVSTGDSSHQTRKGVKVVMEKFASIDMDAATTGVDSDDPGYYNMKGVKWAMRITNSGEFLHAAPWNAGYFGRANMSHGCTGMSTADAGWIYQNTRRGDLVTFTGSSRGLEDRNGWTDWNVPWEEWVKGSALPLPTPSASSTTPSPAAA